MACICSENKQKTGKKKILQNLYLNETFNQSIQKDIATDVSIAQPYFLESGDDENANRRLSHVQKRQVFDFFLFIYSSVKPKFVKPFHLFLSASDKNITMV